MMFRFKSIVLLTVPFITLIGIAVLPRFNYSYQLINIDNRNASSSYIFFRHQQLDFLTQSQEADPPTEETSVIQPESMDLFLKSQQDRRAKIKKSCTSLSGKSHISRYSYLRTILTDKEGKFAFCPIYKSASTSWTKILLGILGVTESGPIQEVIDKTLIREKAVKASQIRSATSFLIVREPLERLVSCYRDKYQNASKMYYYQVYGQKMVSRYRKTPPLSKVQTQTYLKQILEELEFGNKTIADDNPFAKPLGPTFEEFAKYVVSPNRDDEHWRPHYIHCGVCLLDYEFMLRFENLQKDSELFLRHLKEETKLELRWDNPTKNGATTSDRTCEYISKIGLQLYFQLINKYQYDYDLFDYDSRKYEHCAKKKINME